MPTWPPPKRPRPRKAGRASVSFGYLATTHQYPQPQRSGPWQDLLSLQALQSSENGVTTAENYDLNGQSDYSFSDTDYVSGMADYLRDTFSDYRRRTSEILGYGRRLLATDTQQLDLEFGAGVRQTRNTNDTSDNFKNTDTITAISLVYTF